MGRLHYDQARAGEYISHQLTYAGAQSDIFTDKAIDHIFEYSKGIARTIDDIWKPEPPPAD